MWLSKSKFIAGRQCLKRLYLEIHQPELAGKPDEQPMAVLEQACELGRWAQKLFPGGVLIEPEEMDKALRQTGQAVRDRQRSAIFKGTFTQASLLARVYVLERHPIVSGAKSLRLLNSA